MGFVGSPKNNNQLYPKGLSSVFAAFLLSVVLSGCQTYAVSERVKNASAIASENLLEPKIIKTEKFSIAAYYKITKASKPLRVYIEGDGYTWKNNREPSDNPTPINPLALKLARLDSAANILYLARPCQFVKLSLESHCTPYF